MMKVILRQIPCVYKVYTVILIGVKENILIYYFTPCFNVTSKLSLYFHLVFVVASNN